MAARSGRLEPASRMHETNTTPKQQLIASHPWSKSRPSGEDEPVRLAYHNTTIQQQRTDIQTDTNIFRHKYHNLQVKYQTNVSFVGQPRYT